MALKISIAFSSALSSSHSWSSCTSGRKQAALQSQHGDDQQVPSRGGVTQFCTISSVQLIANVINAILKHGSIPPELTAASAARSPLNAFSASNAIWLPMGFICRLIISVSSMVSSLQIKVWQFSLPQTAATVCRHRSTQI